VYEFSLPAAHGKRMSSCLKKRSKFMKTSKFWIMGLCLLVAALALSACWGSSSSDNTVTTADAGAGGGQGQGQGPRFQSAYLNNTYDNALPVTMQMTLGIFKLEGTDKAVTADEAKKLLPLWQSLQSGSVQNGAEVVAVYKQIEGTMTPDQMQAIAALKLTRVDLQSWAQSQGIQIPQFFQGTPPSPEAQATRRAEFQNLSPEAQATRRAQFQNGQGRQGGQGGQGQGRQRFNFMLDPLIKLLTTRAGQ
jgi:hypothetical protein